MKLFKLLTSCSAMLAAVYATSAAADTEIADFYKSHPIRMIVGFSPGGGVDTYSRMLARHMGAHIPGNPNFIVQNMPGAGSLKAVQSLNTAPRDGTYIVGFNPGAITRSILEPEKVKFRFDEVSYLGSISSETQICFMWPTTGVKTFEEYLKRPSIHIGASSPGSTGYMLGAIMKNMFGANITQVTGYPGRSEQHLAIERGELDGNCGTWGSTPQDWRDNNRINTIVRLTKSSAPGMPDVPFIKDFANEEQKQILTLLLAVNDMFRPYITTGDVPGERLKVLQEAFMKTVTGKPFLDEAERGGRVVQDPMPGPEVSRLVAEMYQAAPEIVEKARAIAK